MRSEIVEHRRTILDVPKCDRRYGIVYSLEESRANRGLRLDSTARDIRPVACVIPCVNDDLLADCFQFVDRIEYVSRAPGLFLGVQRRLRGGKPFDVNGDERDFLQLRAERSQPLSNLPAAAGLGRRRTAKSSGS